MMMMMITMTHLLRCDLWCWGWGEDEQEKPGGCHAVGDWRQEEGCCTGSVYKISWLSPGIKLWRHKDMRGQSTAPPLFLELPWLHSVSCDDITHDIQHTINVNVSYSQSSALLTWPGYSTRPHSLPFFSLQDWGERRGNLYCPLKRRFDFVSCGWMQHATFK